MENVKVYLLMILVTLNHLVGLDYAEDIVANMSFPVEVEI